MSSESVPLLLPRRRRVVTKKGMSKLIDSFPQPNTHDLYLMMSTICDHDLCEPDPATNYEPTANQTLMIQVKNSTPVSIQTRCKKIYFKFPARQCQPSLQTNTLSTSPSCPLAPQETHFHTTLIFIDLKYLPTLIVISLVGSQSILEKDSTVQKCLLVKYKMKRGLGRRLIYRDFKEASPTLEK